MKKRGILRTLTLALVFNAAAVSPAMAQRHRETPAPTSRYASIAIEEETGKVLYERDANKILHPASTTKLMTAYLVFQALRDGTLTLDQELTVSHYAASQPATNLFMMQNVTVSDKVTRNGKKVTVSHVEHRQTVRKITVENALRGMLCHSANDAAVIFAEAISGSQEEFVKKMNAEARRIGMTRTHYANPNGLPNPAQTTTVDDMAKLARVIIEEFPEDYKYFSIRSFTFNGHTFANTNKLLGVYPGMDGMKTGWISASGFNLVASAKQNGTRVIGIVFGASQPDIRNEDMRHLLDFAFQKVKNPQARFAYGPEAYKTTPQRIVALPTWLTQPAVAGPDTTPKEPIAALQKPPATLVEPTRTLPDTLPEALKAAPQTLPEGPAALPQNAVTTLSPPPENSLAAPANEPPKPVDDKKTPAWTTQSSPTMRRRVFSEPS